MRSSCVSLPTASGQPRDPFSLNGPSIATSEISMRQEKAHRLLFPPADNHRVGLLVPPRPVTARRLAPGRDRTRHAYGSLSLATVVVVVHRVRANSARVRPAPKITGATGLVDHDVILLDITHLSHSRPALEVYHPKLAGG